MHFAHSHRFVAIAAVAVACSVAFAAVPAHAQAGAGMTLRYTDAQGSGCLTIQNMGATDGGGGSPISVTLTQNGVTFTGQGEEWSLSPAALTGTAPASPSLPVALPRSTALAFWLDDGMGDTFFFDGALRFGVDTLNAQGSWSSIQNPAVTGQWQGFEMFPARPCTGT